MKSSLVIISSILSVLLLICIGCEPEPQTSPPAQQVQTESDEQQPGMSQEEIEAAFAEMEEMAKQAEQQAAQQTPPETAAPQSQPEPEPEPIVQQEQSVPQVEPQPEPQPQMTSPDDVLVTVNGDEIKKGKIDEMVNIRLEQIKSSSRGRNLDEAYIDSMRERLNKGALEAAIIETLIDQKMKEHNISVSEMQIEEYITQLAAREGMTIDDLKSLVTSGGKTFEQWKEQMQFDKIIGVLKIAQLEGFGSMDVNDNDVQKFYEENKARYETPEQVKASHILIKPDTSAGADPNTADAEARAKAEDLLKQIKEDADFAQLAQGNSACPSSARGGDLGFGQRRTWVGPFADAAFALQPGQISDVVKTRFGYHIIKVTERKEAGITSFDEAKDQIKKMLQARREAEVSSNFVKTIRKNADVVYAEGIQPYESEQPVQ